MFPTTTVSFIQFQKVFLATVFILSQYSAIGGRDVTYLEKGEKQPLKIENVLTWDSLGKQHQSRPNELDVGFEFHFQNRTDKEVRITNAYTSCGCTVAKLPKTPWIIKPGQKGSIPIIMDLRGKTGIIAKETTVITNLGNITLTTKVSVGPTNSPSGPDRARSTEERAANLRLAAKNRQAVFQNNCIECHVKPTIGKRGKQLYATACGICHDAKNRAPFVTELRALSKGKDKAYWNTWIADSKPGSLMPAFAKKHGGILDDSQIKSLVAYLTRIFPRELKTKKAVKAAANNRALPLK